MRLRTQKRRARVRIGCKKSVKPGSNLSFHPRGESVKSAVTGETGRPWRLLAPLSSDSPQISRANPRPLPPLVLAGE